MLRITDARTGEPVEVRRVLSRVHAHVERGDTSALRVLLVADVLARALELDGIPVLLVADPGAELRERADRLGIRPTEAPATGGGRQVLHVGAFGEPVGGVEAVVEVAPVTGEADEGDTSDGALRLALLAHARRTPVHLDATALTEADALLDHWRRAVADWATRPSKPVPEHVRQALRAAWEDDLDVPGVLDVLRDVEGVDGMPGGARFETYAHADRLLGLELTREIGASA